MKKENCSIIDRLSAGLTVLGLAALSLAVAIPNAQAVDTVVSGRALTQAYSSDYIQGAAALQTLTNATITSTASPYFQLPTGSADLGIWLSASSSGAGTSNLTVGVDISPDPAGQTLFTTTQPIQLALTLNGTTAITQYFMISHTNWTGAATAKWTLTKTTQTNPVTITLTTNKPTGTALQTLSATNRIGIPIRYPNP